MIINDLLTIYFPPWNLNAVIINDLLTIYFSLMKSPMKWKVTNNMWRAFWIFSCKLKIFYLILQIKLLMKISKVLIFNCSLVIPSLKTKIKDWNHDRWIDEASCFSFFFLFLSHTYFSLFIFSSLSPSHLKSSIIFSSHPNVCCLSSFFFLFFFFKDLLTMSFLLFSFFLIKS